MKITFELDEEHAEKLKILEKRYNKDTAEIIAFIVDEVFNHCIDERQNSGQSKQQRCSD
ncbi:hypothetical protein [Methylomonas koyamae]|uniref:hypothetical protein n=1 Tax=Methylomonas koyamae TaxID=702114 RepID=UPI000AD339F3|nr:hypothetical protein [Methylomonas koyamae]